MIRESLSNLNFSLSRLRTLPPRTQLIYLGGTAVILFIAFLSLWLPWQRDLVRLRVTVPQAKVQHAQMQVYARELNQLRASGQLPVSGGNLLAILEQSATANGLRQQITRMEPDGANGARLSLDGVNFNALVGWLANLQSQGGVRIEKATIDPLPAPGTVNAKLSLRKAGG